MNGRTKWRAVRVLLVCLVTGIFLTANAQQTLIPVKVELFTRAVSKLPVLIAYDKGLYKKYGLDVQLWLPKGEFPGAFETPGTKMDHPEFSIDGGVPMITEFMDHVSPRRLALATTDNQVRFDIIGQKGMKSLEDIKGKRLGVSWHGTMTDFISRVLARRMGWQIGKDIIVVEHAQRLDDLIAGKADAFIADDRYIATAKETGYPILADTSTWNQPIAGNSVRVEPDWFKVPKNRDIAMRFLKATVEGLAVYVNNRDEALHVLAKYNGITDPKIAGEIYEQGLKMPRKPYPSVKGFEDVFALYDSPELRKYKPSDFYDEGLIEELDRSGFIDAAYKNVK